MAWLYILECCDKSYYVGSTTDLERRVAQHKNGLGCAFTAERRPVRLVFCHEFQSIREAYEREQQVKKWRRAKKEALIRGEWENLPNLARSYQALRLVRQAHQPAQGDGSSTGSASPPTGS